MRLLHPYDCSSLADFFLLHEDDLATVLWVTTLTLWFAEIWHRDVRQEVQVSATTSRTVDRHRAVCLQREPQTARKYMSDGCNTTIWCAHALASARSRGRCLQARNSVVCRYFSRSRTEGRRQVHVAAASARVRWADRGVDHVGQLLNRLGHGPSPWNHSCVIRRESAQS